MLDILREIQERLRQIEICIEEIKDKVYSDDIVDAQGEAEEEPESG